jgi:hypothetical protein
MQSERPNLKTLNECVEYTGVMGHWKGHASGFKMGIK